VGMGLSTHATDRQSERQSEEAERIENDDTVDRNSGTSAGCCCQTNLDDKNCCNKLDIGVGPGCC